MRNIGKGRENIVPHSGALPLLLLSSSTHRSVADSDGRLSLVGDRVDMIDHRSHARILEALLTLKGCLHYDTCTPYMYVVQVYGVHVS